METIVSRQEWLAARQALLVAEKKLAGARTAVVDQRRALPWTRVEKAYAFDTPAGPKTLTELFDGRSRLIVYHFMFAPEWQDGCPGCSMLGNHLDGLEGPLARQDAIFTAISRAPLEKIEDYRKRKGWRFRWVSSQPGDFNYDYQASFRTEQVGQEAVYGFETCRIDREDLPGTSVFARDAAGEVFHTYSAYTNGGDMPLSLTYLSLL
jgi:predicted dithiol-disulfide oxidoreductase (DUF899 family)